MIGFFRVFRYELQRQGRRRSYILTSIGVPILALVLFYGFQFYQQIDKNNSLTTPKISATNKDTSGFVPRPTGIIDRSGLLEAPSSGPLKLYPDEQAAQDALKANEISAYYVVAQDYLRTGQIDMYFERFNIGNLNNNSIQQLLVKSLAKKSSSPLDPDFITRLQTKPDIKTHTINAAGNTNQSASTGAATTLVYVFGMALIFSAFMTSGYLMQSIVEEKETRMIEVLLSSLRPIDLLAGKILALGLLGLLQMILWGATMVYIFRQAVNLSPELVGLKVSTDQLIILVIYFILGYLLFAAIYASIGALSTSMREGPQIAGFFTIPFVIPLYVISLVVQEPNGSLATTMSIFPITAPLGMVMRIALTDVPLVQLLASMALLVLTILAAIWVASRLFRVNTLLSGQMPKLREIPRLVRESL